MHENREEKDYAATSVVYSILGYCRSTTKGRKLSCKASVAGREGTQDSAGKMQTGLGVVERSWDVGSACACVGPQPGG